MRKARFLREPPHDRAWHEAEMAKGWRSPKTGRVVSFETMHESSEKRMAFYDGLEPSLRAAIHEIGYHSMHFANRAGLGFALALTKAPKGPKAEREAWARDAVAKNPKFISVAYRRACEEHYLAKDFQKTEEGR